MFSKLVSKGSNFVMEGVKNLVVKKHASSTLYYFFKTFTNLLTLESTGDKNRRSIDGTQAIARNR